MNNRFRNLLHEIFRLNSIDREGREENFSVALDAVNSALLQTRIYIRGLENGDNQNFHREAELSQLWMQAAHLIRPYDGKLAGLCITKGNGWVDPTVWTAPENRDLPIKVDQMLAHIRNLTQYPLPEEIPKWIPIAGAFFTFLTIFLLFYLLVSHSSIDSGERIIFDVMISFCAAASFSFFGGKASAEGKLPSMSDSSIKFAVVGGIAVFVIIFLLLYSVYH
jgi:hypothetical protein